MGFMPQVEWILRRAEKDHQTLLFSATLDGMVGALISRYQTDPVTYEVASRELTVAEMEHRFLAVHEMDRVRVAARIIEASNRTIIFSRTKWGADKLTVKLVGEDVRAAAIHGDLRQVQREKALADFQMGRIKCLVATDVAARGIHVDDVDVVIHYDPPSDAKTYVHRSGPDSTGRGVRRGRQLGVVERGAGGPQAAAPPRDEAADRGGLLQRRAPGRPDGVGPGRRGRLIPRR